MPNLELPQTYKPPFSSAKARESIKTYKKYKIDKDKPGIWYEGNNIPNLQDGTILRCDDLAIKDGVSGYHGREHAKYDVEYRSVFEFQVFPLRRTRLNVAVTRCTCYPKFRSSYDATLKSNQGVSGANFEVISNFIVTINSSDLFAEELAYSKELWRASKGFSLAIPLHKNVKKHLEGEADFSSIHPGASPHNEGWDLYLVFKTGLVLTPNELYRVGVGTSLIVKCLANDARVDWTVEDNWKFREIKIYQD